MRAAVLRGGDIVIEDVADPSPRRGQLVIAPHATGICGSDLHLRRALADAAAASPDAGSVAIVPGHEFAGEVMAVGPGTDTSIVPGDLVTAIPFTFGPAGPETIGLSPTAGGGLAELTVVDAERTFVLPEGVDTRLGALCEPVAVAVHAFGLAAVRGPIVVVGAGPIGLGVVAIAAVTGRSPIIVVEPSPARRAMAERLGADAVHAPGPTVVELLAEVGIRPSPMSPLLDDEPVTPTVFECVGRPEVVTSLLGTAPPHARVVLAGACSHPVQIDPLQLTLAEVSVEACFAYRPHEFRAAAGLLQQHPDRFGALITSERHLDATAAAFDDLAHEPTELKILITPS